jgi:hypothetical protein
MAVERNRGAVLLAELKALVDSLPHHRRAGVIKMTEIAFKKLNADFNSRHSVDQQTALGSPCPKSSGGPDSSDEFKNEDQE